MGLRAPCAARWNAAPMIANSTSWAASDVMLAPTSSTAVTPFKVGQLATMAGRSRSLETIRRISLEIAIRAPVLPAESAACASPWRRDSTAFHRLEPLPRRRAWAGFSSMAMTRAVWRMSQTSAALGQRASSAFRLASSPCNRKRTGREPRRSIARDTAGTTTGGP